ncbi:hypothetical protein Tco_0596389 [Tanacetum coccineum]
MGSHRTLAFKLGYTIIDSPGQLHSETNAGIDESIGLSSKGIPDSTNRSNQGDDTPDFGSKKDVDRSQGLHIRYLETAKDTKFLRKSGELCGFRKDPRRRILVAEKKPI